MPHDVVRNHSCFGWDMDETLVNGTHSEMWRSCVLASPEADHYVVTFRKKDDALKVWDELESLYELPLTRDMFTGLLFMPDRVRLPYDTLPSRLRKVDVYSEPDAKTKRALVLYKYEWEDVKQRHQAVHHWKAEACKSVGATVLVDDLEHLVKPGCDLHGVEFVNSLKL